jgi:hypothetical protein
MARAAQWVGGLFDHSWLRFCDFLNILSVFIAGLFFAWKWLPIAVLLMFLISWAQRYELVARLGLVGQASAMAVDHGRSGRLAELYAKVRHVSNILTLNLQRDALIMAGVFGLGTVIGWMVSFA